MSKILRRPMFRGGPVNSYGTGIASGLADGGRVGFRTGGSYLTLPDPVTSNPIGRTNATNTGITGISLADFFKPVTVGPTGFSDYRPGDRLRQAEREKFPMYDEFMEETESDDDGTIRLASLTDEIKIPRSKSEANVEAGLPTSTIEEPKVKKQQTVETPTVKQTEDNEVTMTDLERALGLDDARKEYVGDALAAASKAFFEGRGFEAISDAARVKSKAPDIKRLAGLEEFKAKKAKELYEAQTKAKRFAPGNVEKTVEYLVRQGIPKDEAIRRATKQAGTIEEAIGKYTGKSGIVMGQGLTLAVGEFFGSKYKGDKATDGSMDIGEVAEIDDGVYTDKENKLVFEVKDKKVVFSRKFGG